MKNFLTGKRLIVLSAIVAILIVFIWIAKTVDFEEAFNSDAFADLLRSAGPFAPIALILIMAIAVVISPIPSLPLDLAAGAVFGPALGATYAVIGAEIGAIISFLIARALGRELLSKLLRTNVVFCERCSDHHLVILLVLARLLPVFSFDIISYGAGLTNVSLKAFALATLIGMIPPTFALTYLGSSAISAQWPLILSGVAMVAFFLLTPKLVMRYPSSWWARLLLAAAPAPPPPAVVPVEGPQAEKLTIQCSGCRGPLPQP